MKSEILLSNKNENILPSNYSFDKNNNFSSLFTNIEESKILLQNYETFISKYFETINAFFKQLTEFNYNFLIEDKYKSVINSPIFQLGRIIKKAVQEQINNLYSIICNQEIFFSFKIALTNLSKILKSSPAKYMNNSSNKNSPDVYIKPIVISLMESFSEIESKVIDDYIGKKYNKHILGLNNEPLKDNIEKAIFLEKTFLDFEEDNKKQLLNDLHEMEIKTTQIFNEMKNIVKDIVNVLKKNSDPYYEELTKEIDIIGKRPISNVIIIDNNNNDIDANKKEIKLDLKENNDLDMFKYQIKIINNPIIHVSENLYKNEINKNKIENIDAKEKNDNNININNNIVEEKTENENKNKIEIGKKEEEMEEKEKQIKDKKKEENNIEESKIIEKENLDSQEEGVNNDKNNEIELTLNDEDLYNIISILYSYDFKMLDNSKYNLEKEKIKVEVFILSQKLLTFDAENNIEEIITDNEVNSLYELMNDRENIFKFFVMLNNYRATGRYEATERAFNIIINIFIKTENILLCKRDLKLEGLLIILSQTFYKVNNGEKIYLQKAIKDHAIFKKDSFWDNYLNDSIEIEVNKMKEDEQSITAKLTEEQKKKKISDIILSLTLPISTYMKEFEIKDEIILNITNKIFDKYEVDNEKRTMILSLLENNN